VKVLKNSADSGINTISAQVEQREAQRQREAGQHPFGGTLARARAPGDGLQQSFT